MSNIYYSFKPKWSRGGSSRSKPFSFNFVASEQWGYIFGYFLGDGYLSQTRNVSVWQTESDNTEFLRMLLLDKFVGLEPSLTQDRGIDNLKLYSKGLKDLLLYLGFKYGAGNKEIPEWLIHSTVECKRGLLKGLFDSDGSVMVGHQKKRNYKYLTVTFSSTSEILRDQVHDLLGEFGIPSRKDFCVRKRPDKDEWKLDISSKKRVKLFNEIVGFHLKRKRNIIEENQHLLVSLKRGRGCKSQAEQLQEIL